MLAKIQSWKKESQDGQFVFSYKWPTSGTPATAGLIVCESNDKEWVIGIAWERFVSAHEAAHGREPEKTWPTPINVVDPSPPGCIDYVFVEGARVVEAGLAFDKPHPFDPDLFPSDHLGVMARLEVG